jgi:hypothetical protein
MKRTAGMLLVMVATLFATLPVRADTRVTVHEFYGPNAARLRGDVAALLAGRGVTVVPEQEVESTARKPGLDRFTPDGRKELARHLQLSGWLTGMLQRRNGKLALTVVVYAADQRARVAEAHFVASNARALRSAVKERLWDRTGRALVEAAAPAANEAPTVEPAAQVVAAAHGGNDDRAAVASEDSGGSKGHGEALRAFVGVGSPMRNLAYDRPVSAALGDYQLSGAPVGDVYLAVYPMRFAGDGVASWFGVEAHAQFGLNSPALSHDGYRFRSRYDAVQASVRARIPLGSHSVSAFSGYSLSRFRVRAEDQAAPAPVPSVDYRAIRSGLGSELALSEALHVGLEAAWLQYLSVGEIASWFPRATAGGFEVGLAGTYHITGDTYMRVAAAYRRTFFSFHAQPTDTYVAQGAVDQSIAMSMGLGVQL